MPKALSVFWSSLGTYYSELFPFAGMNLLWFVFSLPVWGIVTLALAAGGSIFPGLTIFAQPTSLGIYLFWFILLFSLIAPNPASAGICYYANQVTHHRLVEFGLFWTGLRLFLRKSLLLFAISLLGLMLVLFNLTFYLSVPNDYVRLISVLFLYFLYFWLSMQFYLLPLLIEYPTRSLWVLLKNAALVALDNPGYTLILFILLTIWSLLCLVLTPLIPLASAAVVSAVQNRALLNRLEKYGLYKEEQE